MSKRRKVARDVDHALHETFREIVPLGGDLAAIGPEWKVINLSTGKVLGTGDASDPLTGRGAADAELGWILTIDGSNRLSAWKINKEKAATAPPRSPATSPWPDVKLFRDGPKFPLNGIAHSTGGGQFVTASSDGKLTVYTADRLLFQKELEPEEGPLRALARVGEKYFVLGRKSVVVRDAETLEKVAEYPVTMPTTVSTLVFAVRPDGNEFVVATDKLRLVDVKLKKESVVNPPRAAAGKPLTSFAYAADGKSGVARWGQAVTTVWHPRQTTEGRVLEDLKTPVSAPPEGLVVTPDGKVAVVVTQAGEVRAWNTATGKVLHSEAVYKLDDGRPLPVDAVAMLPDGKRFLTVAQDGRVMIWGVDGFTKMKAYKIMPGNRRVSIAPDGSTAVLPGSGQMALLELPEVGKP